MRLIDLIRRWLGGTPTVPPPTPPPGDPGAELLAAVNAARQRAGVRPLAPDPRLTATAQGWAGALAARGGPIDHGDWYGRLTAAHPAGPVSEDIAGGQRSAAEVVADWLADPPHRRSVLGPPYTVGGCGVASRAQGWVYYVLDLGG